MINWDYMITYGGPEIFIAFIVIVGTPFIYWMILKRFNLTVKIIAIITIWIIAILIAYLDVYQISKDAQRMCQDEAGLHVIKTVETDGFLGPINIEYWSEYGFKYVEGLYKGDKTRSVILKGDVVRKTIPEYTSRYQVKTKTETLSPHFSKATKMIVDRQTNEILGDIVSFTVYPGWLDRQLLGLLGFTWGPARCDGDYPPKSQKITIYSDALIKAVLKATNTNKGGEQ